MEFGRVTDKRILDAMDWALPAEPVANKAIWSGIPAENAGMYVGAPKWALPNWLGKVYPKGTKATNFLDVYARNFNCIELNASFYHLPAPQQLQSWLQKTKEGFLFCPKFPEAISHARRLYRAEPELREFEAMLRKLGSKCGPAFLVPHPHMGPETLYTLIDFVRSVPPDIDFFIELRHPGWFDAPQFDLLSDALTEHGRGLVLTDTPGRRDALHMRLTRPDVFIRFLGSGLHPSDYIRLDQWVERIGLWLRQGLRSCYFFMHQHDELYVPELCQYFIQSLNKRCGLSLKVPQLIISNELF